MAQDEPTANDTNKEDPHMTPVIDARMAALTALYGDRFDDGQRAHIRGDIAREVFLASQLRGWPLVNADEPEIVFTPFRGGE
jgi:hypothetical protein